jgi:hypothetical protein
MNPTFLPALSVLLGSATGALTSVATTWLAHRHQQRSQCMTQERARRERIFSDFIDQASKMFADALTHSSVEDPAKLVPLYATMAKLRLFASERTISAAQQVMKRILESYYLPNADFKTQPSRPDRDFDILLDFIAACRAELSSDGTERRDNRENVRQDRRLSADGLKARWLRTETQATS